MSPDQLTAEQKETVRELQSELRSLNLQADVQWAKYIHTKDEDCFREVMALESEIELKGLVSYIPKAGELKVSKVRKLVSKVKQLGGQECEDCDPPLGRDEVRLSSLEQVNVWRANYELPPLPRLPKGTPGDAAECTLARAFSASMQELGIDDVSVDVSDNNSITLEGWKNGEIWEDRPELGYEAHQLIADFDQNAWLDLLDDQSLENYAEAIADGSADEYLVEVVGEDAVLARLQEISDEAKERGLSFALFATEFEREDAESILMGADAPSLREQRVRVRVPA